MIEFLHPWVLAGLAAAGLPLLLHLVQRRQPPTIPFPAVRYLVNASEQHQKRLRLRNWLLLALRMLLIAALVTAAAGPTLRSGGAHAPTALVLILDNSASTAAVSGGTVEFDRLRAAARAVLARARARDELWLLPADGVPRRGSAETLATVMDSLRPVPARMDLGAAISTASRVLEGATHPGRVVLVTDLQASAATGAAARAPLLVVAPNTPPPADLGIAALDPGPEPWTGTEGRVTLRFAGDTARSATVGVSLGGRLRRAAATGGGTTSLTLPAPSPGWWVLTAELDPDEFPADDRRVATIRVAPPAAADWTAAGRELRAACEVLADNHRLRAGRELAVAALGRGLSVVVPPDDPAALGALNRALARRGVPWSYARLLTDTVRSDSGALVGREMVTRRYELVSSEAGTGGVLATVGGRPWIVRAAGVILLGSRLDSHWSALPLSAGFVPFVDRLLNQAARGGLDRLSAAPGDAVTVPEGVTAVTSGAGTVRVEGGTVFRPRAPGSYLLLRGRDTVGALDVNLDPREAALRRLTVREAAALWPGSEVVELDRAGAAAFAGAHRRGDLGGPLLWLALLLAGVEVAVATGLRRR